jgi:hypothetical protein
MQDDYDDEQQEIYASVDNTIAILQTAVDSAKFARDTADEDASNDTFFALVQMLRKLRTDNNICITTLVEEAMQDE